MDFKMTLDEAIEYRHSVRRYKDIPLDAQTVDSLKREIESINREGELHFQLVLNEPRAFSGAMARYGKFEGAVNYVALVGKKCDGFDEKIGYYGERLVLFAQRLGLHTCWVALTYKKIPEAFKVARGEKFSVLISIGHGRYRGVPRKTKSERDVSNISPDTPEWFKKGIHASLLAPTAMNQQKFFIKYLGDGRVSARAGVGFYTKMDLGIVKYHFECGAGSESFSWV